MERIGVRELRQNASEWIRRAQAGECIEITKRGRLLAVIGPPPTGGTVGRLREAGRLKPPSIIGRPPRPVKTRKSVSEALAALRADER
jgi:prevent-host-death family protein